MKKIIALMVLCLSIAAPSFGADIVGRSAKAVSKDSYKAVKFSAKETGHASKSVVHFLF
jgi:hypothetical protein